MQVSERSVRTAKKVLDHGAPELIKNVEKGEISVFKAAAEIQQTATVDGPAERKDLIRRLIYDEKDSLSELITDYLNHRKRYLEKSTEWSVRPRCAPADNELRKVFRKEAILEIWHVHAAYWHDEVVRDALSVAIDTIRPSVAKGKRKPK
jgi:predicted CopG family antitoxin